MTRLPEVSWKQVFERPERPENPNLIDRAAMALADSLDDGPNWTDYREQVVTVLQATIRPDQSIDVAEILEATGAKQATVQPGMTMTMGSEPLPAGICRACGKTETLKGRPLTGKYCSPTCRQAGPLLQFPQLRYPEQQRKKP